MVAETFEKNVYFLKCLTLDWVNPPVSYISGRIWLQMVGKSPNKGLVPMDSEARLVH